MRLHSIRLQNFRLFKDETFEFKPLTILTGPNSSGKSTVVKALMLLQENLTPPNSLGRLTFKNGDHKLGSFNSILTRNSQEKKVKFSITFENTFFKKKEIDKNHLFDNANFFHVQYEFEQHPTPQLENGILTSYEISITVDGNRKTILSIDKNSDENHYTFFLDINWLINRILDAKLFQFSPKIYLIWDKINYQDFNTEFERRKSELKQSRDKEIQRIKNGKAQENSKKANTSNRLDEIDHILNQKKFDQSIQEKITEIFEAKVQVEKSYDYRIQNLKEEKQQLESVESKNIKNKRAELKSINNIEEIRKEIESLELEIEQFEDKRDEELRKLNDKMEEYKLNQHLSIEEQNLLEEKYKLEYLLEEIIKTEFLEIENKYEKDIEEIREGNIRSELYNQVENAAKSFLKSVGKKTIEESVLFKPDLTIPEYLNQLMWGDLIYSRTQDREGQKVVDLIPWSDATLFIKKILEKEEEQNLEPLLYSKLIGEGNENQLAQLFIFKTQEILNLFSQKLSFVPVSAMRGFQQRLYKTNKPSYHLEDALSMLLSMQYQKEEEKLNFIQKWVKLFGLGEKIKAVTIEGDFVKGVVEDKEENKINIADMGLGIAQLVPIIIFAANSIQSNSLICIEEPGTHLHPNLQALLVEFIEDAIKQNVQFLFETHSEYFIRKLQYEVIHNKKVNPENISIRYLDFISNNSQLIQVNEKGELIDNDGDIIESFGTGFLDEATKWVNKREIKKEILKGNKIVACEGTNEIAFQALNLPNCIFIGRNGISHQNNKGVFITVLKEPDLLGIRDRDFLTDSEIDELTNQYSNYKILKYYSYESYLYHPKNIEEALNNKGVFDFDSKDYIDEIRKQKNQKIDQILFSIEAARNTYEELKYDEKLKRDKKNKERNLRKMEIINSLRSDEFEEFYKYFNMKKEFDKKYLEKFHLHESELYLTNWFKSQIASVLEIN